MKIIRIFSSVRLTNVILPAVIIELIVFTLIPGGRRWISSPVFLFPLLLFLLNLSFCSVISFRKKRQARRFVFGAVDLIHIGMMLLVVAGLLTPAFRQEAARTIAEGEQIRLPGGGRLLVGNLGFSTYEDGRPRSWSVELSDYELRVNRPLRLDGIGIYLTGFSAVPVIESEESGGYMISQAGLLQDGRLWLPVEYLQLEGGAWSVRLTNGEDERIITAEVGFNKTAVIMLVKNPLRPLYLVSFIVLASGMAVLSVGKLRGLKK